MIQLQRLMAAAFAATLCVATFAADGGSRDANRSTATVARTSDTIRAEFAKLIDTYNEGLTTQNVEGILKLYSSDPVFVPEYAPPAVGREAVRKAYEWVFATLKLNGRFIVHEAEIVGDRAWVRTSSTGRFTVIATGVEADFANSEFFLFKREAGAWKIHRYIFTTSAPQARN